jgi:hypothetical protein
MPVIITLRIPAFAEYLVRYVLIYVALLDMTISGGYPNTYAYTFLKTKRSSPLYERTFVAIKEMDYALNKVNGMGIFTL